MFRPSKKQIELLRHTLGLSQGSTEYRNHFCADVGHDDYEDLMELCREGYMYKVEKQPDWTEGVFFMATNEGKAIARSVRQRK